MKHDITRMSADIMFTLSALYILGQAGALDLGRISIGQFITRMVSRFIVLGIAAAIIIYYQKEKNALLDGSPSKAHRKIS